MRMSFLSFLPADKAPPANCYLNTLIAISTRNLLQQTHYSHPITLAYCFLKLSMTITSSNVSNELHTTLSSH